MEQYRPGYRGTCPHCATVVLFDGKSVLLGTGSSYEMLHAIYALCPNCRRIVVTLETSSGDESFVAWPIGGSRPVPTEVPADITKDYREASAILYLSPKASAALSRRCLQAVLRDRGNSQHDLSKQIDAALPGLPLYIRENLDAVRNIGNFAAHPGKDQTTGEIIDVEPGEAEWNLDVLDELFEFYYVAPAIAKAKRDALNAKLQAAGKPPMK